MMDPGRQHALGSNSKGQPPPEVDYRRKSIIEQAGDITKPGCLFKQITMFFADRKFITIAFVHLTITLVIFSKCTCIA